ncbi:cytochrome P450 98A3 [Daedaleopsis nitida]|nr:cytochrome P450 98A3 [Daedaleopsis nitida]
MPMRAFGTQFRELSNIYGDVVYLNILGREIITLGSYKAANDLLDKRSSIYSGRMASVMADMCGMVWNLALKPYGPEWRLHRRTFHQYMNSEVVPKYGPIQTSATRTLARRLLDSPQNWNKLIKFSVASSIMSIVYGIDLDIHEDTYFDMFEYIAKVGDDVSVPGRYPVEAFPWLRYLPSWFPGGRFKTYAATARRNILHTVSHLFDTATTSLAKGSVVAHLLENLPEGNEERAAALDVFKEVCATMYVGASDTTHASLGSFFLAMALYPDVQKKAQAELDAVVGSGRLPEYEDMDSLPYIRALVKELLRWHVVTPLGVPHTTLEDDEYNGYTMPEGATIFVNTWAISRDPDVYPDPEHFVPERFLDKDGKYDVQGRDPTKFIFGFGRRVCPGRHFAEHSLLMACATLLWTFDISPPIDANGEPVEVKYEVSLNTIISHATALPYTIKPRSAKRAHVVQETTSLS